jgi:hypothetical protein
VAAAGAGEVFMSEITQRFFGSVETPPNYLVVDADHADLGVPQERGPLIGLAHLAQRSKQRRSSGLCRPRTE